MNDIVLIAIVGGAVTLVTSLVASIPGLMALRQQRKKLVAESEKAASESNKVKADAAQVVQEMTLALVKPYQDRVAELEKLVIDKNRELTERVGKLECELDNTCALLVEVADCATKLHSQVVESGGTPVCVPPTETEMSEKLGRPLRTKPKKRG